jgi:hypothetical protein
MERHVGKRLRLLSAAVAIALPSLVCAQQSSSPASQQAKPATVAQPASSSQAGSGEVAARIGDRVITMKELDDAWKASDPAEHHRVTQSVYDGRKAALDRMIANMLIEQAAKAKGVSADQFAQAEAAKRIKAISDTDITTFYQQNQSRMGGKPLEDVKSPIRAFLMQQEQQAAHQAFVDELRKNSAAINVSLEPPRLTVDVAATDPAKGGAKSAVVLVEFSDYQ